MAGKLSPCAVASTLYIPATAAQFMEKVLQGQYPWLSSITLCLEDSIAREDVPEGIRRIGVFLSRLESGQKYPHIFIRPRDVGVLRQLLEKDLGPALGFVAPKFCAANMRGWEEALKDLDFLLMPTLETAEVFEQAQMIELRQRLTAGPLAEKIVLLRIGGNDLQQLLGIERMPGGTIYDGALASTLGMLAGVFLPAGFALSAPVLANLDDEELLAREIALDIAHGFCGKSAVNPRQARVIAHHFAVTGAELDRARAILGADKALFRHGHMMCEPAVQKKWALNILDRFSTFGLRQPGLGMSNNQ